MPRRRYRRNPPMSKLLLYGALGLGAYYFLSNRTSTYRPGMPMPAGAGGHVTVNPDGSKTVTLPGGRSYVVPGNTPNEEIQQAIQATQIAQSVWGIGRDVINIVGAVPASSGAAVSSSSEAVRLAVMPMDDTAIVNIRDAGLTVEMPSWSDAYTYQPDSFDASVWADSEPVAFY